MKSQFCKISFQSIYFYVLLENFLHLTFKHTYFCFYFKLALSDKAKFMLDQFLLLHSFQHIFSLIILSGKKSSRKVLEKFFLFL